MEILSSKFQASVFCDLASVKPETHLIQALFTQLVTWNVFPNIVKELSINITPNLSNSVDKIPTTVDRMQFISSDKARRINLLTNRIDIELFNPNPAYKIENFHADVVQIAVNILRILDKKAIRLSLVSSYFNQDNHNFFSFNDSIFSGQTIEIAGQSLTPTDWNQRFTYSKNISLRDKQEKINLNVFFGKSANTAVQLQNGRLSGRFELTFDINTNQRTFDDEDIGIFYQEATKINEELKRNIIQLYSKKQNHGNSI